MDSKNAYHPVLPESLPPIEVMTGPKPKTFQTIVAEPQKSNVHAGAIAIATIVIVAIGVWYTLGETPSRNGFADPLTVLPNTNASSTPLASKFQYKDGTYTASSTFNTPGGFHTIDVTLVIKDDIITDSTFVGNAQNQVSAGYEKRFNEAYKSRVVGQDLRSLSLSVVNGSSVTTQGFMTSVTKIRAKAAV